MIKSVFKRQNVIILHILFSDYYVIYLIYTVSISAAKHWDSFLSNYSIRAKKIHNT